MSVRRTVQELPYVIPLSPDFGIGIKMFSQLFDRFDPKIFYPETFQYPSASP
jgi:hypothetical protein